MTYVIAASRPGYEAVANRLSRRFHTRFALITRKQELTLGALKRLSPRLIFLPHWSFYVPKEVFENFECVTFHMTDLPFGRGGSPLQNLIVRGFNRTKLSAIRTSAALDAGPVYLKRSLSLHGTAQQILERAAQIIEEMIVYIIQKHPTPRPQKGRVTHFIRRKPEEGSIQNLRYLKDVYNFIRMLDGVGYPRAFAKVGPWRLEFERATLKKKRVMAYVNITPEKN